MAAPPRLWRAENFRSGLSQSGNPRRLSFIPGPWSFQPRGNATSIPLGLARLWALRVPCISEIRARTPWSERLLAEPLVRFLSVTFVGSVSSAGLHPPGVSETRTSYGYGPAERRLVRRSPPERSWDPCVPHFLRRVLAPTGRPGTRIYRSSKRYVSDRDQILRRDRDRACGPPGSSSIGLGRPEAGVPGMGPPGDTTAKELPACAGFCVAPSNSLFLSCGFPERSSRAQGDLPSRGIYQASPGPRSAQELISRGTQRPSSGTEWHACHVPRAGFGWRHNFQNCARKRGSFSKSTRMSGMPKRSMATRSTPNPKAKPV